MRTAAGLYKKLLREAERFPRHSDKLVYNVKVSFRIWLETEKRRLEMGNSAHFSDTSYSAEDAEIWLELLKELRQQPEQIIQMIARKRMSDSV